MPQLICTTDEIGYREGRDILFLSFRDIPEPSSLDGEPWERIAERQTIVRWLNGQGISWESCLHCSPGTLAPHTAEQSIWTLRQMSAANDTRNFWRF